MHCDKSEENMIHTHHFLKQIGKTSLAVFLFFSYGCSSNSTSEEKHQTTADTEQATQTTTTVSVPKTTPKPTPKPTPTPVPTCDGTTITTNCQVDGIVYSKYIYHPAIPESSHVEIVTTYENQIVDYKTQCNDGTWSPSNAKGKGACSHHGGVYDFYAPVYGSVRVDTEQTVIDPAVDAWYETEVKK